MKTSASHLADSLARHAEAVCRRYLSNGRRYGGYWIVGDVRNTPGASTFVRLGSRGPGNGAVGKWSDGATGEHGDLLDVIRETCGLNRFHDVADEARRFLDLPRPAPEAIVKPRNSPPRELSPAKRLVRFCRPIAGTLAEAYLWRRGVTNFDGTHSLRFHPACFYRPNGSAETQRWPALIGVVTDLNGGVTGVHRTWLDPDLTAPDHGKAPIENPKRSLGDIWTHAVRFGIVAEVMAAGEGIETSLSLRSALPALPMIAALSASHLAAVAFPPLLRRLYIASDADPAGRRAAAALGVRAREAGIEAIVLLPTRNDFNDDLIAMRVDGLRGTLGPQLAPGDFCRFMSLSRQP
jgi:Toprim domain